MSMDDTVALQLVDQHPIQLQMSFASVAMIAFQGVIIAVFCQQAPPAAATHPTNDRVSATGAAVSCSPCQAWPKRQSGHTTPHDGGIALVAMWRSEKAGELVNYHIGIQIATLPRVRQATERCCARIGANFWGHSP